MMRKRPPRKSICAWRVMVVGDYRELGKGEGEKCAHVSKGEEGTVKEKHDA